MAIAKRVWPNRAPSAGHTMTTVPYGKMRAFDNQEQYASSTDTVNMIHSVIDWLSIPGNDNWLLIFDNFDDIDLLDIRKFIPRVPAGNVLITSRRKDVSSYWKAIEIRRMSREEGRSLLAKPSGIPEERLDGMFRAGKEYIAINGADSCHRGSRS